MEKHLDISRHERTSSSCGFAIMRIVHCAARRRDMALVATPRAGVGGGM